MVFPSGVQISERAFEEAEEEERQDPPRSREDLTMLNILHALSSLMF